ncbi:MAG TPA: magnesium transporter [Candidatus Limnocylindrales bacterium]|nr:magnesium transporter [Candidatus Limnocylindrales bacterium]
MSAEHVYMQIIQELQAGSHPGDLLDLMEELDDQQKVELLERLSDDDAAKILQEMEDFEQASLVRLLGADRATAILRNMPSDDATDLLGELSPEEAHEMLQLIGDEEDATDFGDLLKYPAESAGGIMTTEYISFPEDIPVEEAISRLRIIAPEAETIYYIYVVNQEGCLIGVISLRDLIASADGTLLKNIMRHNVISVNAATDQEEVARVVSKYDLLAVPVVDDQGRLLGIVTVDDVLDVLEQEATEDIYHLAGASEVEGMELTEAPVAKVVRLRLPWLLISMVGGILSGSVIGRFESTLESIVMLAMFIPVIMDMGGNVGTQSSTIFVRGIATGEIDRTEVWPYFFREVRVGIVLGIICGIVISVVTYIWQGNPYLGLAVGISMMATIMVAALIGTLVPLLCNMMHIDPAITAGPFVTTIKDITGLLIYFSVASIFLEYLR